MIGRSILLERPRGGDAHHSQRGFTLIELMLALGLLALLLIILFGCFRAVAHSKIHAEQALIAEEQGRAVMFLLSKELRGVVQTPFIPSRTLLIGQGQGNGPQAIDSITFSTIDLGHRRSLNGFGSEEVVTYAPQPNPQRRGWYLLTRSQQSALLSQTVAGVQIAPPTIIANNLLSLHIQYFDGVQWLESWDSRTAPSGMGLPQAVSIELAVASPGGAALPFSTRVTLPMALLQK